MIKHYKLSGYRESDPASHAPHARVLPLHYTPLEVCIVSNLKILELVRFCVNITKFKLFYFVLRKDLIQLTQASIFLPAGYPFLANGKVIH